MLEQSMFVQCGGERSRMSVRHAWETSPTLVIVPAFIQKKRNKMETNKDFAGLNNRDPKFIIIIIIIKFFSLLIIFIFTYFICSPNFLSFSINKAKVKFAK